MWLKSPTENTIHVALLSGHAIRIGPEPVDAAPIFVAEAMAMGCIPANAKVEEIIVPKAKPVSKGSPELLREGIVKLLESDDPEAFTGSGLPNRKKLSNLVGWTVTAEELQPVWNAMESESKI